MVRSQEARGPRSLFFEVQIVLYGLFGMLGKVLGLVVRSGILVPRLGRGQTPVTSGGKAGGGKDEPLGHLTDSRLAGAVVAGATETARAMLSRPSVRASLEAAVLKLTGLRSESPTSVEAVREIAEKACLCFRERSVSPDRIGIDGIPGSGKSTLARALSEKLGFQWRSLDQENMNVPIDFSATRTVYEHHRLFRTQNVDVFDVIIHIHEPAEISKTRVIERARTEGRESLITDVLDYDKLKEIGELAFEVCQGQTIRIPDTNLLVKIRPPEGFCVMKNIDSRLRAAGLDARGLTKEETLFLLTYGKPKGGLMAYFKPGAYNAELLRGLVAGTRSYLER